MATFCILWYRRGQEVHEFFLFFFKFNSDSIFFYVDLVRWQRTKATLKKIFFSVRLKLLNKKDFETTLWARVGSIRGADTCTFLTPQMRNVAPNHIHIFWFWFEKLVRCQRTNFSIVNPLYAVHSSPSNSILPSLAKRSRKGVETRRKAAKRQDNTSWDNSEVSLEPFF